MSQNCIPVLVDALSHTDETLVSFALKGLRTIMQVVQNRDLVSECSAVV